MRRVSWIFAALAKVCLLQGTTIKREPSASASGCLRQLTRNSSQFKRTSIAGVGLEIIAGIARMGVTPGRYPAVTSIHDHAHDLGAAQRLDRIR